MTGSEQTANLRNPPILTNRRFLTCPECGWVHYAMTPAEKAANDHFLARYQLTAREQELYESAFRQCLRCESPANMFRFANERDLDRAESHLVTPVLVEAEIGTH